MNEQTCFALGITRYLLAKVRYLLSVVIAEYECDQGTKRGEDLARQLRRRKWLISISAADVVLPPVSEPCSFLCLFAVFRASFFRSPASPVSTILPGVRVALCGRETSAPWPYSHANACLRSIVPKIENSFLGNNFTMKANVRSHQCLPLL